SRGAPTCRSGSAWILKGTRPPNASSASHPARARRTIPPPAPMSPAESLQTWDVVEGTRGQQLLDPGLVGEAIGVFEAILARLGNTPSYGRAVTLGRVGRFCYME